MEVPDCHMPSATILLSMLNANVPQRVTQTRRKTHKIINIYSWIQENNPFVISYFIQPKCNIFPFIQVGINNNFKSPVTWEDKCYVRMEAFNIFIVFLLCFCISALQTPVRNCTLDSSITREARMSKGISALILHCPHILAYWFLKATHPFGHIHFTAGISFARIITRDDENLFCGILGRDTLTHIRNANTFIGWGYLKNRICPLL